MQLENKPLFTRNDMLDAIHQINHRWGKRLCKSASVHIEKAWEPSRPKIRGTETCTNKELFCISPQLSLPAFGLEVQVAYLPEKAYAAEDPDDPIHLTTENIDELLAFCHSKVGMQISEEEFEEYVAKTVDVNKGESGIKPKTVRTNFANNKAALDVAAARAAHRRSQSR